MLSVISTTGCLVLPIKTGTHIQNPTGGKDKLPKFAIVPGQTTREEVEQQYQAFRMDSGVPNLFWARFRKSTWAMVWAVGGYGGATGGGGRMWGTFNLMVRFDENGKVVASDLVQDKELLAHLQTLCTEKNFPTLDLSQPARVGGEQAYLPGAPVELQLLPDSVVIKKSLPDRKVHKRWVPQPPVITTIPSSDVTGISARYAEEVRTVPLNIKFSKKTTVGKSISFNVLPADVLTLVRWQQQVQATVKPYPNPGQGSGGAASGKPNRLTTFANRLER
jgi:hypothetical protein